MIKKQRARRSSPLYVTPAFDLLPQSYDIIKKYRRVFAILYIFPLVIGLSNGFWVVDLDRHLGPDTLDAMNAVGNATLPAYSYGRITVMFIFAIVVATALKIMLQSAQLKAIEDHKITFRALWKTTQKNFVKFFLLYAAVSALTLVWLIPAFKFRHLWFELICFIPVVWMLRRYFVAPYVLLENPHYSIWEAMSKSAQMTSRDAWSVYSLIGLMALFALFGIIPYLGWIIAFILLFNYSAAPALRYKELKRLSQNG
jgi:hypothetical protein